MIILTIEQVHYIAHDLAKCIMEWNEPIPDFHTRFPGILESCLKTPFQSFAERDLYPGIDSKAAVLFYLLIKNHPFQNGNKRIAVTSLLTFCLLNDKWLVIPPDDLYRLAIWVAESSSIAKDGTILAIKQRIKRYLSEWSKAPFKDGEILISSALNRLCSSVNALEQFTQLQPTQFRQFQDGTILKASDLNSIMFAIEQIEVKRNYPRTQWQHMPVRDGEILKADTMNEIWNAIRFAIKTLQSEISNNCLSSHKEV